MSDSGSEERLSTEYVPLSKVLALLWRRNPKLHSIGDLVQSFKKHGFRDAPAFDEELQPETGGAIVDGNGRIEALAAMKAGSDKPPRGILVREDGEWLIPIQFGINAESKAAAEAYAIDANNTPLLGGDFTDWEMARMWDASYSGLLEELAELDEFPVSADGDSVDMLLEAAKNLASLDLPELEDEEKSKKRNPKVNECPKCGHRWSG